MHVKFETRDGLVSRTVQRLEFSIEVGGPPLLFCPPPNPPCCCWRFRFVTQLGSLFQAFGKVVASRNQLPLRLAYAITIHKSVFSSSYPFFVFFFFFVLFSSPFGLFFSGRGVFASAAWPPLASLSAAARV